MNDLYKKSVHFKLPYTKVSKELKIYRNIGIETGSLRI